MLPNNTLVIHTLRSLELSTRRMANSINEQLVILKTLHSGSIASIRWAGLTDHVPTKVFDEIKQLHGMVDTIDPPTVFMFVDLVPPVKRLTELLALSNNCHVVIAGNNRVTYVKAHSKIFDKEIGYNNPRVHFCIESNPDKIQDGANLYHRALHGVRSPVVDHLSGDVFTMNSF